LEAAGKLYVLGDMGAVSDGYKHSLFVSGDGKVIYIVQVGGIAGTYKVFGPLDPAMDCSNKAPSFWSWAWARAPSIFLFAYEFFSP